MQIILHHFIRNLFVFLNKASGGRYILRYNINSTNTIFWTMRKKLMNFLEILSNTMNWIHVYLSSPFYSDNDLIKSPKYCVTFPWIFKNYFCLSGCHFFIHHCSEVAITFYSLLCSLLFFAEIGPHFRFFDDNEWCLKGDQKKKNIIEETFKRN